MSFAPSLRNHTSLIRQKIEQWRGFRKCTRCTLPEAFRDITFDENGVCNHCTHYLELVERVDDGSREDELLEIIDRFKAEPGADYDVVVCYSGGKDSSYLLERFLNTYGLRVLAVTVKTGFNAEIAQKNVANGIENLGVDHCWLEPDPHLIDVYRFGFTANSGNGLECDVCDLCDGHMRRQVLDLAIERRIPLVVHAADHFQLVDCGLDAGASLLYWPDACWPKVARHRDVFRQVYELRNFDAMTIPPVELYPFLYLPYNEEEICASVLDKGLVIDPDPDVTNCDFVFLINLLELFRNGYPAYIHNTSAAILQGEISIDDAQAELIEWLEEYLDGRYDERIFAALPRLGLSIEELIEPGDVNPCSSESARGVPVEDS